MSDLGGSAWYRFGTPEPDDWARRKALRTAEHTRGTAANEVQRFGLARADMRTALAAVRQIRHVPAGDEGRDLRLALETVTAVIYARPFNSSRIGNLSIDEWRPEDEPYRTWHDELLGLRHRTYAHTDRFERSGRRIRDPLQSRPRGHFTEEWLGWEAGDDLQVERLLERQFELLTVLAEAAQRRLREAHIALGHPLPVPESAG